jgi:hypothetical protein
MMRPTKIKCARSGCIAGAPIPGGRLDVDRMRRGIAAKAGMVVSGLSGGIATPLC